MKQLCIRLDEKTLDEIQDRANQKALKLSEYLRRLIRIGLKIEALSEQKSGKNKEDTEPFADLGSSKALWEKELTWTLEMRFLIRILADQLLDEKDANNRHLLQESKIRAENFVAGLLNQEVNTSK